MSSLPDDCDFDRDRDFDRDLLAALAGLRAAKPILERLAGRVDGRFAALGEIAASIGAAHQTVGERSRQLATVVRDKEGLVLAFQFFKKARDVVDANLEQMTYADAELGAAEVVLRRFTSGEDNFTRSLTAFWYLSTAIRIEAGSLSGGQRVAILTLAEMLTELHRDLGGMVGSRFADLAKVLVAIGQVRQKLQTVRTRARDRMAQSVRTVMGTFEALDAALDHARAYGAKQERHGAKTGACFERIVVALQSQDIVRQKLESVIKGFATMLNGRPVGAHLSLVNALSQVEQRQLADAEREIVSAEHTVTTGIGEFMVACEEALGLTLEVRNDVRSSLAGSATTSRLLDCLRELEQVVEATSSIAGDVSAVIQQVRIRVVTHVDALSKALHALRLIALNAQVRAAKVSSQTALETLAAKTKETSEQMREDSSELLDAIRSLVERLETLEVGLKDIAGLSAREQAALRQEGTSVQEGVKNIETSLDEGFGALEGSLGSLRAEVAASTTALARDDELVRHFAEVGGACEALARGTAFAPREPNHTLYVRRLLDELRTGYTIRDQRVVHDESVTTFANEGGPRDAGLPAAQPHEQETPTDAQSLGDNIELF